MMYSASLREIKNSVSFTVLKVVFSIYFLFTISLTGVHMYAEYINAKHAIINELKHFETVFKPSMAKALWTLENELIGSTAQGILKSPVVVGVQIRQKGELVWGWQEGLVLDDNGQIQYIELTVDDEFLEVTDPISEAEKKKLMQTKLIRHDFDITHINLENEERVLGDASLYSSTTIVFDEVKWGFAFILMNAIIKTILLWYLFLWGGVRYLSRPLGSFTSAVGKISLENLQEIHVVEQKTNKNELNTLEESFNRMVKNLRDAHEERLATQRQLEISQRYLQDVVDSMPNILIGVDLEGNVTHWNKAAEALTRVKSSEAEGFPVTSLFPYIREHAKLIPKAMQENTIQQVEKLPVTVNEEACFFELIIYPLHRSGGGVMLMVIDITDKVRMENMMVQTEKMTSLGTLAAGMAHEINNPLGGILQGIQNVHRRLEVDLLKNLTVAKECDIDLVKVNHYLEKRGIDQFLNGIKDLGERAAAIVRNVLKFSRQSDSVFVEANINLLLEDAIAIISTDYDIKKQTDFKHVDIRKKYDNDLPLIECAQLEVEQVILNLLKNAAHATSDVDHPAIVVETYREKNMVCITVADNGSGMDEQTCKRLFEPFFTTKPVGVGTGLGLSISYYIIVDKHGGSLDVESKIGQGSKFILKLPIIRARISKT